MKLIKISNVFLLIFLLSLGCSKKQNTDPALKDNSQVTSTQTTLPSYSLSSTYVVPKVLTPTQKTIMKNYVDFFADPQWKTTYDATNRLQLSADAKTIQNKAEDIKAIGTSRTNVQQLLTSVSGNVPNGKMDFSRVF